MGSIKEKIKYIKETKKLIREAIIAQGVDVPENTTFRDYANKIDSIKNTTHVSDNTTLTSGTAVEKKIYYLSKTKENIKRAIVAAGVSVLETDTFRSYANKIAKIKIANNAPLLSINTSVKLPLLPSTAICDLSSNTAYKKASVNDKVADKNICFEKE